MTKSLKKWPHKKIKNEVDDDIYFPPEMLTTIEEDYDEAVEIAEKYQRKKQEETGKTKWNQPIPSETLIPLLSEREKEVFGEDPQFSIYPWKGDIYVIVSGFDICSRSFGEDFLRELLKLIIKSNEN